MKPLVIFHAGCADGFCAAWVARKALGKDCEFLPMNYGDPLPTDGLTAREIYVLDFSFKLPVTEDIIERCRSLVVLDHHRTAEAELRPLMEAGRITPVTIRFDMAKSGGRMTWEHFFGNERSPWLVDYTEDRDLWRWKLPDSRAVSAFLASYPFDFDRWDRWIIENGPFRLHAGMIKDGEAILRYQRSVVEAAVKKAVEIEMDGHKVLSTNATILNSEIGEALAKDRPFSATYFIRGDGAKVWSLRSAEDGIDVSQVAKRRGGGGHKHAAGFTE